MIQQHVHAKNKHSKLNHKNTRNKCLNKVIKSKMLKTLKIFENIICLITVHFV